MVAGVRQPRAGHGPVFRHQVTTMLSANEFLADGSVSQQRPAVFGMYCFQPPIEHTPVRISLGLPTLRLRAVLCFLCYTATVALVLAPRFGECRGRAAPSHDGGSQRLIPAGVDVLDQYYRSKLATRAPTSSERARSGGKVCAAQIELERKVTDAGPSLLIVHKIAFFAMASHDLRQPLHDTQLRTAAQNRRKGEDRLRRSMQRAKK